MFLTQGVWAKAGPIMLMAISVLVGVCAAFPAFDPAAGSTWDCSREWVSQKLSQYGIDRLPAFALDSAVRIKESVPDAVFTVEYLHETRQRRPAPLVVHHDPFLVVKRGSEIYYVECWDELDFERLI